MAGRSPGKKTAHAAEQDRPDVAAAREAWFEAQPDLDPARLIVVDETGLSTRMARLRGRCARGQRLRSGIPHGHWKVTTFVAGLRLSGLGAPMVLDGPMTRDWFLAYVAQVLAPTLTPGDIVILDNLPAHKGSAIQAAVEARRLQLRGELRANDAATSRGQQQGGLGSEPNQLGRPTVRVGENRPGGFSLGNGPRRTCACKPAYELFFPRRSTRTACCQRLGALSVR